MPKTKEKTLFEELRRMRLPKLGATNRSGDKTLVRVRFNVIDGTQAQIYILEYDQKVTVYAIYVDHDLNIDPPKIFKLKTYEDVTDYIEIGDNTSMIDTEYAPRTLGALRKSLIEEKLKRNMRKEEIVSRDPEDAPDF